MLESGTMTLGVNYWASRAATEMWSRWDADAVDRDFRSLRNTERLCCAYFRSGRTSSRSRC